MIQKRIQNNDGRINNKNKKNKILYTVGQRVRLQNVGTKDWDLKGTVERLRYADDGRVVSYYIMTDLNNLTTRHRRYLKPLHPEHDPHNPENDKIIAHKNTDAGIADLPNITPAKVPRRSSRTSKVKAIRTRPSSFSSDTMGSEFSSIQAPFSVNIELTVGEEELARVRELWRNITINNRGQAAGERADRQEHATRQGYPFRFYGGGTYGRGGQRLDGGGFMRDSRQDYTIPK